MTGSRVLIWIDEITTDESGLPDSVTVALSSDDGIETITEPIPSE